MDELKPCPFCGGKADYVGTEIECLECGVMMPKTFAFEMQVDNWNTRPIEDALRAQLAEAQAEVERLKNIVAHGYHSKITQDIDGCIE